MTESKRDIEKKKFDKEIEKDKIITIDDAMSIEEMVSYDISQFKKELSNTRLDKLCGGFSRNGVHVFAGGSGSGKSYLLMHLAYRFSITHDKVCYFSFENDLEEDIERMHEIKGQYFEKGSFDYYNYQDLLSKGKVYKNDELMELLKHYDYVFLDAFQIVYDTASQEGAGMHTIGNAIMTELTRLAIENHLIIFMTWQLQGKATKQSKEDMSIEDMSYSMGVSRYAKTVWIIDNRPCKEDKNEKNWTIKLDKTRSKGERGKLITLYDNTLKAFYLSELSEVN